MARKFLPALRRGRVETKVVTPVAFAQYYSQMSGYGYTPTREWPIERAVTEGYDRVIWLFKGVQTTAADCAGSRSGSGRATTRTRACWTTTRCTGS